MALPNIMDSLNKDKEKKLPKIADVIPEYATHLEERNKKIDTGRQAMAPLSPTKPNLQPVANSMNTQPLSMSNPLQRSAKPVVEAPKPTPNLRETVQPVSMQQPNLVKNFTSVSTPSSRREQFVDDRLAQDRQAVEGNKILSGINKALEPVSRAIYSATSASPIAAFQQGAGQALGMNSKDIRIAPVNDNLGSKIGGLVGQIAGPFANPIGAVGGLGNGLLGAGRGLSQEVASQLPAAGGRLGRAITEGAAIGALEGGYSAALRGEDVRGIATDVALGGALGAAGDAAITGIAQGLRGARNAPNVTNSPVSNTQPTNNTLPQTIQRPNTDSIKKLPTFDEALHEKLFGRGGVGITAGRGNTKELIDTHVTTRAKEQSPVIERFKDAASVANQDYVDKLAPFRAIDDNNATYNAAMDSSRANNLANVTIKDKFVDLEGNVRGNSLKEIYEMVPRGQKDLSDRYLIMRDAIDRMDRNIRVYGDEAWFPKTADEAAQRVAQMESQNPWLVNFGEAWNQFNRNRQDLWVESGIASQQLIDTLRTTNPNYAPMQRQMPNRSMKNVMRGNQKEFSGQKAPIKRAVGSSRKIIEPVQSMINSTATSYHAMMRNRAMQNLYEAVSQNPEKYRGIIEIVPEDDAMRQATLKRMNQAIEEDGLDGLADILNNEMDSLFTKSKQQSARPTDNHVTVMINGNPVKMNVQEKSLLRAIEGVSPERLEGILRIADTLSRGVKTAATGALAPLQGVKLFARDIPVAFAQSKDKLRFLQDISQATVSQIANWLPDFVPGAENLGKLAREYYRAGGGYEQYLRGDSRIRAAARDITRDPLLSGRNIMKQVKKTQLGLRPFKELGDAFENIPRIAAFQAAMRKSGWSRDEATIRNALNEAREATVNWSRKGARGQQIESVLPYSNAAVQGTYRFAKFMKEQPVSALGLITAITGASIASYEKYKDDPDYKNRSKYSKGIIVGKRPDGKFITVPTEPAYQYIADQVLNFYAWAKDQEEMPSATESIQEGLDAFTPKYIAGPASLLTAEGNGSNRFQTGVANTLGGSSLEPLVATATGKNYFGGDIVPREYQDNSTPFQQSENTSAAANWAAENLGIDAFTFDYLAQKFGGDLAKVGLPMTSKVGRGDPTGNMMDEVMTRLQLLEDPVMKNNISNDYYKYADKVTQTRADANRSGAELPSWYESVYDNVTSTKKGSIASQVSDLNKEKKNIQSRIDLTAKQRSDMLRGVQTQINLLRIEGIRLMEEAGVPN